MRYYFPISSTYSPERRRLQRFTLRLPAKVEVLNPGVKQVFNLMTGNVSACGAYFQMLHPIPENTRVRVTITITNSYIKKMTGSQIRLMAKGQVIRSGPKGMGIRFDKSLKLERIRDV